MRLPSLLPTTFRIFPNFSSIRPPSPSRARAGLLSANMPCDGCTCQSLSTPPTTICGAIASPCPTVVSGLPSARPSAEGRRTTRLRRDRPPRRFPPTGLLGQAHLPPLCRMDRSYRLHLVLPTTILQHPLLPQRGSQYPHRHHHLGRLLPDGDQRIRTLISNALASGLEGLFLDMQESEEALFLLPKEEDF